MRRALLAVLFVGGLLASCAGPTEEDERLGRESQRGAWSRAWSAVFASAPAAIPQAAAGGPVGWITGGAMLVGAGVSAYAAARKPGSKPTKGATLYDVAITGTPLTPPPPPTQGGAA